MNICTLDTKGEWMVNSNHLYIPSKDIKVEHTNLSGSETGRMEDGTMRIDWIRTDITKVHLRWPVMTQSELDYTMNLLQGKEFEFRYKDRGKVKTFHGYCGESSYTFYTDSFEESLYKDISINVIEM